MRRVTLQRSLLQVDTEDSSLWVAAPRTRAIALYVGVLRPTFKVVQPLHAADTATPSAPGPSRYIRTNICHMDTQEIAAYNRGIEAAIKLVEARGKLVGGAINPEITIKALLKLLKLKYPNQ